MSYDELLAATISVLKRHEGVVLHVYPDTLGIKTIGVGFNLEQPGARAAIEAVGADYDALLAGAADLTGDQCDALLSNCIIANLAWLGRVFPDFAAFSIPRQVALLDMSFMGEGSFLGFKRMIAAVNTGDWQMAVVEALDSKWAAQVGPTRSHDDANGLLNSVAPAPEQG